MQKVRTGGNVVLDWSPNLQNGERLERPELTRIFSNSRTGRTDWHRNQFVPLPSRPPPEKPPEEYVAPKHRRHLIYLALYRDKVDQHQAAMLAATTGAVPSSPQAEAGHLAATTGHFPVESQDSRSRRDARDDTEPALTAHTAAVKASGIGLDEHVEVKRLGKLFDEWIEMTQQDVDEVYEKLGLNREGSKTLRPRAAKPGGKSWRGRLDRASKAPSSPQTTRNEELEVLEAVAMATTTSLTGTTTGGFSQGLILAPRRNPDRKKLDRLWTVLTNPKVRCASLKDKAGYQQRDRQMPTKIEGIKPLMLYKLYNGPWRLDV